MSTKAVAREAMTVAQISKPGGDFEVVEREIPDPGTGQVRIKIQAFGVCHSDVFTKEGHVARHRVSPRSRTRSSRNH
jgi:D-arabinose 1-dehydrogenase-like Zn-dependent alcohol dehydrogenase